MPVYKFELRDGTRGVSDKMGIQLPSRRNALDYARGVVRELMGRREVQTRWWRLNVCDKAGERIFEIPFVTLDQTLDHLRPNLRAMVARNCDRVLSLHEMIASADITMRESHALVARSRGKPYLAADRGERTIRDC
jgi:hypothetical protein